MSITWISHIEFNIYNEMINIYLHLVKKYYFNKHIFRPFTESELLFWEKRLFVLTCQQNKFSWKYKFDVFFRQFLGWKWLSSYQIGKHTHTPMVCMSRFWCVSFVQLCSLCISIPFVSCSIVFKTCYAMAPKIIISFPFWSTKSIHSTALLHH